MFELRSFRPDDAEAVWMLHDLALEDAGAHGGRGPWEQDLRDIAASYLDTGGDFLVGVLEAELVAVGGVIPQPGDEAEIKRMRVHPAFQRRGLGRLLLERLEHRALELGCRRIRLDTTEQQTAARRLYESAGYRETGRRQTPRFVFIDYAKTLDSSPDQVRAWPQLSKWRLRKITEADFEWAFELHKAAMGNTSSAAGAGTKISSGGSSPTGLELSRGR